MKLSKDATLSMFEWAYERQSVYRNKEAGLPRDQWTSDPIIPLYRSCNVYRELDRVSKVIEHTICKNDDLSPEDKFINIYLGRMFNFPEMYEDEFLGISRVSTFDWDTSWKRLEGKNSHAQAYLCFNAKWSKTLGYNNAQGRLHEAKTVIDMMSTGEFKFLDLDDPFKEMKQYRKMLPFSGEFVFSQIYMDMYVAGLTKFSGDDWLIVGPGAMKGVNYLCGGEYQSGYNNVDKAKSTNPNKVGGPLVRLIHKNQRGFWKLLKAETGKDWQDVCLTENVAYESSYSGHISLMDVQNMLCDYRKYVNHTQGVGKHIIFEPFEAGLRL